MSESSWELVTNDQPRSVCLYVARDSSGASASYNPFDAAVADISSAQAVAVVFGTDKGSLHYRTFPSPTSSTQKGTVSSPTLGSRSTPIQYPLGSSEPQSTTGRSSSVPKTFLPVDLTSPRFPGSVVLVQQTSPNLFLLLVDDHESDSAPSSRTNQYWAGHVASLEHGQWRVLTMPSQKTRPSSDFLPRMTGAVWSKATGIVYTAGRTLASLTATHQGLGDMQQLTSLFWPQDLLSSSSNSSARGAYCSNSNMKRYTFHATLPAPGARTGSESLGLTAQGQVVVCAVGSAFYAVAGTEMNPNVHSQHGFLETRGAHLPQTQSTNECVKIMSFAQTSQVHPVLVLDIPDPTLEQDWSAVFLANGRECAVVDLFYSYPSPRVTSSVRHGSVTCPSPILGAAASWPWIAILTSDGLVSIRSPSCLGVSLRTVEIGRPNDYFCLRTWAEEDESWIVATSYSGAAKVLPCHTETAQDFSDRLMRLAIDAFGANGFPRVELAEAVNASFTATSYVGPEPSQQARLLLLHYLEASLGLTDFASGAKSGWPTDLSRESKPEQHRGALTGRASGRGVLLPSAVSVLTPDTLLTSTSLLCLVCMQVSPPQSSLASRATIACAEKIGLVLDDSMGFQASEIVCEKIAEKMLKEASSLFNLVSGSSPTPITRGPRSSSASMYTDFMEAAVWLLRACGKHEQAIEVAYERLYRQGQTDLASTISRNMWSRIKYESYTATHLSELWSSGKQSAIQLVLKTSATRRLLETNPRLGLSVFTAAHPQTESQWRSLLASDDPLAHPQHVHAVVGLLKSIIPSSPPQTDNHSSDELVLPLESGRDLVINYLESALGIEKGRRHDQSYKSSMSDPDLNEETGFFHDELAFILLEAIISERSDEQSGDSPIGKRYREKLRRLLRWSLARFNPERLMDVLPSTFLQEKALVLGRVGRHEDAIKILYRDMQSLDLALEYCDELHNRWKTSQHTMQTNQNLSKCPSDIEVSEQSSRHEENAYMPLIRVALTSSDKENGIAAVIRVLASRKEAVDSAAALKLLPSDLPLSTLSRPFLIPAMIDSESQVRRLTVASALLRARYLRLKEELTASQLKVQSNILTVPELRNLSLGEPIHSTNPFRVRKSSLGNYSMVDVMIVKHFFPHFLVVQAKVLNASRLSDKSFRTLAGITFIVAESSDDAIQPVLQVPIQRLPPRMKGSAWCVLTASPARMEGPTAQLTCELRYTVSMEGTAPGPSFVEELQDVEVNAAYFT